MQPEDKDLAQIPTNIGNHWMEPWIMEKFATELMGFSGRITHSIKGATHRWNVTGPVGAGDYSTQKRKAMKLCQAA